MVPFVVNHLRYAGLALHVSKSRRLIIRAESELPGGSIIVDEKQRKIGKVAEIFGPVAKPYASIIPMTSRLRRVIGNRVFFIVRAR
ncbi:MAG: hypothetical protein CMO12_03115 [Thaumarchaeota archaeon]|nr:hypothetical protein [Nitrososphaerota archaeon]